MTNVCMNHIYKVIYDLSVYLVTFDFGLPYHAAEHAILGQILVTKLNMLNNQV